MKPTIHLSTTSPLRPLARVVALAAVMVGATCAHAAGEILRADGTRNGTSSLWHPGAATAASSNLSGSNSLAIPAVPESSAAALGGLGVLLLLRRRRPHL